MVNAVFKVPTPFNEPVCSYAPGSSERESLKQALHSRASESEDVPLRIGTHNVHTKSRDSVFAPHDHSCELARVSVANKEHVEQAIESCLTARAAWANLPWHERASVFLKAADLLTDPYRDAMNSVTMLAQGKTCFQSEIDAVCELADFFRFNAAFAEQIYQDQPMYSPRGLWNRTEARGLEGFVFAISPFNFSSIAINLAAAPALMGCTVLWKPSLQAVPACSLGLQILEEAGLPPGVINLVSGGPAAIAEVALSHPSLSGVHFTGSTRTFESLWKAVGERIEKYDTYPRIVGETGGKDFIFAHPTANPDQLKTALIRGAFEYQGQKCSAASRAYVPRSIWIRLKEALTEETERLAMGRTDDFSNFMSAVIDRRSYDKITDYLDRVRSLSGAEIIAGGEADDSKGFFIRPTIIETSDPHFVTMEEEIFGPVLTVYPYEDDDLDEAVELCRTTSPYALTGAIFATDRRAVAALTDAFRDAAGNFYINDKPTGAVVGQQPFGGGRKSGTNDKAGSVINLMRWTSIRTIKENYTPITSYRYPHMEVR